LLSTATAETCKFSEVQQNSKFKILFYDSFSYSPEFLLMEDVIVVTVNYRLHALGFSCLPRAGISGNAGLKDQQLALKWVHENISLFSGDPDNVCLFGESAGAACVHLHAFNDKSKKFFKSAICQSNYALADWFFQRDGPRKTKELAKLVGAIGSSDSDVLDAMKRASTQQLYDNNIKITDPDILRRNLPFVFKPVVEEESDDAFLTQNPVDMMKTQKIDAPIMFGINDGDGMTMGSFFRNKQLPMFDKDHVRMVPISLNIDPNSEEAKQVGKEIKEFYFGDKTINQSTISQFVDLMTDFHFTIPMTMTNELHATYQKESTQYDFEFCYDGELNVFKKLLKMSDVRGACHFDEIFYLFDPKLIGMEVAKNSPAWNMRTKMCKLWTNFAKYHDPTPDHANPLNIKWNPIKSGSNTIDIDYLRIDEKFEMKTNLYKHRMDFWRKIYKKYNSSFTNPKF
jgi:acetylcholinesterase